MMIQNGTNKQVSLETVFGNVTTPFQFNPEKVSLTFNINGSNQSNLLYVNGSTNRVGIKTNTPDSTFHVVGDIRVGGQLITGKVISSIVAGAIVGPNRTMTVTTTTAHGFVTNDKIFISGVTVPADGMNGLQSIQVQSDVSFTYLILSSVSIGTITLVSPVATKTSYFPGVIKESLEEILLTTSAIIPITASYETTAINTQVSSAFCTLSSYAGTVQTKTIYLKSVRGAGTVSITGINGNGFNKIQLVKAGDTVTLKYDGTKWFITGTYGAIIQNI